MDEYKTSIANVDDALNRLNQTLAAYKLSASSARKSGPAELQHGNGDGDVDLPAAPTAIPTTTSNAASSSPVSAESFSLLISLRSTAQYPEKNVKSSILRARLDEAFLYVADSPYSIPVHVFIAIQYLGLGYPDLAAGAAYKALLLSDALQDDAEEYHDESCEAMKTIIQELPLEERIKLIRQAMDAGIESGGVTAELDPTLDIEITLWLKVHYRLILYRVLTRSLLLCSCFRTAHSYVQQGLGLYEDDDELLHILDRVRSEVVKASGESTLPPPSEWPDSGFVRREIYPWNKREPDRIADLDRINELMSDVSDKLEVRAVELPDLTGKPGETVTQLGVFAKVDIAPGEIILDETSLLTANNKLQDALCDACSGDLPAVGSAEWQNAVVCEECEVVFCSDWCFEAARDSYHPALCDKDVEAIAKDVEPAQAANALYALLLLRALAMAETQDCHPLELSEVRYIWGDFIPAPPTSLYFSSFSHPASMHLNLDSPSACLVPRSLPFSFEHNVRLPLHMLEKMDVDIFANPQYDTWVFNTLYAKFRGTASARLSGSAGRGPIRGPEVSAVHPLWCLANHSCDPNVSWEWGGAMKFWTREKRVEWRSSKDGMKKVMGKVGIEKDEEVLNHYCDVDLPVKERREWARGALGGECMCERCVFEAGEEEAASSTEGAGAAS